MPNRAQVKAAVLGGGGLTLESYLASLGPIAQWWLRETTGTNADEPINNLDGTYVNTPTLGGTTILGYPAPTFDDASAEYVQLPQAGLETRFNPALGSVVAVIEAAPAFWAGAGTEFCWVIGVDNNNRITQYKSGAEDLYFVTNIGGAGLNFIKYDVPAGKQGKKMFVVNTWSQADDRMRLYVDGVLIGSDNYGAGAWTTSDLTAAFCRIAISSAAGPWSGTVIIPGLFDYELDNAQQLAAYNRFKAQEPDAA